MKLSARPPDQRGRSAGPVPRFRYLHVRRQDSMAPGPRSALRSGPCGCHGDGPLCGRGGAGAREQRVAPPPKGRAGTARGEGRAERAGRPPRPPAPPAPPPAVGARGAEEPQPGSGPDPRQTASAPRPGHRPGSAPATGDPGLSTRARLRSSRPRTRAPRRFSPRRVGNRYPHPHSDWEQIGHTPAFSGVEAAGPQHPQPPRGKMPASVLTTHLWPQLCVFLPLLPQQWASGDLHPGPTSPSFSTWRQG